MPTKAKSAGLTTDAAANVSLEEALSQLESILNAMEAGDLPLETLAEQFEDGTRLLKVCQSKLEAVELKIKTLEMNATGEPVLRSMAESATPDDDE